MRRLDLLPDCGSCAALCCVATAFDACEHFAFAKPAGVPCPHLTDDRRCAIHAERVARGFRGCVAYDCYGAGQRVTRTLGPDALDAFLLRRELHELLWLLTEARKLCAPSHPQLAAQLAEAIAALDAGAHDASAARALLRRVGDALGG